MYRPSIFLFNFTFKCNYYVYKLYPGCRAQLWRVFDILMYTILFTIAYLYDYCIGPILVYIKPNKYINSFY